MALEGEREELPFLSALHAPACSANPVLASCGQASPQLHELSILEHLKVKHLEIKRSLVQLTFGKCNPQMYTNSIVDSWLGL